MLAENHRRQDSDGSHLCRAEHMTGGLSTPIAVGFLDFKIQKNYQLNGKKKKKKKEK